jgi:hypothetical protein
MALGGPPIDPAWEQRELNAARVRIALLEELVAAYADSSCPSEIITELRKELGV